MCSQTSAMHNYHCLFNLEMSKTLFDTFAFVINFINDDWVPCHNIVQLFEAFDTFAVTLAKQVKSLLFEYQLINKIITHVKDKGTN